LILLDSTNLNEHLGALIFEIRSAVNGEEPL